MKTLFLIGALALPPVTQDKQYAELLRFLAQHFPDYELVLVNADEKLIAPWYYEAPLFFRELKVYLISGQDQHIPPTKKSA